MRVHTSSNMPNKRRQRTSFGYTARGGHQARRGATIPRGPGTSARRHCGSSASRHPRAMSAAARTERRPDARMPGACERMAPTALGWRHTSLLKKIRRKLAIFGPSRPEVVARVMAKNDRRRPKSPLECPDRAKFSESAQAKHRPRLREDANIITCWPTRTPQTCNNLARVNANTRFRERKKPPPRSVGRLQSRAGRTAIGPH